MPVMDVIMAVYATLAALAGIVVAAVVEALEEHLPGIAEEVAVAPLNKLANVAVDYIKDL